MDQKIKIVHIRWIDSAQPGVGWALLEEVTGYGPAFIDTVGILHEDTPEYISVFLSKSPECFSGLICIPKVCVKELRYLNE
jgi:hypothetical protein